MHRRNIWKSSILALAMSVALTIWGNVDWQKETKSNPNPEMASKEIVTEGHQGKGKFLRGDSRQGNVKIYGWLGASVTLKLGSCEDDHCWELRFNSSN